VTFNGHERKVTRRTLVKGSGVGALVALSGASGALNWPAGRSFASPARAQGAQRLTLWVISSFTPDDNAPLFKAVKQYQDESGVEIVVEPAPASGLRDKLITAVRGGEGPDVVSVDSAWNAGLAAAGILSDVTDRFGAIKSEFFPGPVKTGDYLGKQYAVPWYTNNVALYYNKKMFADAGVKAPPATWDELVEVGKALTSGDRWGLMLGAGGFGSFLWWPFAWQNGATLISEDGKQAEFGSEAGQQAWRFYSDLYLTNKIVPEDVKSARDSWDQVFAPFIQERVGMVMSGDWATFAIKQGNPKLDFAVAPLPKGKEAATVIGGYNLAIPATSKNADAAWKFVTWMTDAKQEWILQGYNRIQARTDVVGSDYAKKDPILQVFIEQAPVGRARATVPAWDEIENTVVADAWDSVILGQASPEDALKSAVQQTNDLLAE
jgi:multiple sugar transport system substrate-binding protein